MELLPGVVMKWLAERWRGREIEERLGTAMCPHTAGQEQPDYDFGRLLVAAWQVVCMALKCPYKS